VQRTQLRRPRDAGQRRRRDDDRQGTRPAGQPVPRAHRSFPPTRESNVHASSRRAPSTRYLVPCSPDAPVLPVTRRRRRGGASTTRSRCGPPRCSPRAQTRRRLGWGCVTGPSRQPEQARGSLRVITRLPFGRMDPSREPAAARAPRPQRPPLLSYQPEETRSLGDPRHHPSVEPDLVSVGRR
jgi:hypothetical protein